MKRKTKRVIATVLTVFVTYLIWVYVSFDPFIIFTSGIKRGWFLLSVVFTGLATYTYPGFYKDD